MSKIYIRFFPEFRSFNILYLRIDRSKFDTDPTSYIVLSELRLFFNMSTGQTMRFRETAIFAIILAFNVSVYFPFHVICD